MNVGVFIKSRNEKEGGGYTITYDILDTLLKNTKLINYRLYFVIINELPKKIEDLLKKKKIKYINIIELNSLSKFKNLLFCKFSFFLKFYNLLNLNKAHNFFKKNYVDIIWPISSELRYPFSIPYFFTVWDLQHKSIPEYKEVGSFTTKFYREHLIKSNLAASEYVITGNKSGKDEILKYYKIKKNKIILNSHPTPSWAFQKKTININFLRKKKIKNYFLYPANFWEHKNHLNLIKGFCIFNEKHNNKYQLVLVGNIVDKNIYKKIDNLIKEKKIQSSVKILGYVARPNLLELYDSCIALTYLSVSGPENLPPLESFARGKPVLHSNFKGAKEQLNNFPVYVNYRDPNSIALGMKKIIKKNKFSKTYKKFSKSKSTKNYISKINKSLIKFGNK
jgi:glycosyltransferase involved in cell wall biosynthesis